MDEEQIRRIVREEIERSREIPTHRGIPLPASPVVAPFNPYIEEHWAWKPNTCFAGCTLRDGTNRRAIT